MNVPFLLQSMRVVADGEGGSVQQWNTIAALWGSLDPYEAGDTLRDVQRPSHVVMTRNRADVEIAATHRLAYNGRTFHIRTVMAEEAHKRVLKLLVSETSYLN